MSFKVVGFTNTCRHLKNTEWELDIAARMREEYGLPHTLEDIVTIWKIHMGYMDPVEDIDDCRNMVEDAFGVILEKETSGE